MALTEKQARFVAEYLVCLDATKAAKKAGYSEKTAYAIGFENLRKPEIQEAIQAAMDERAKRTQITQDRVLQELAAIGFSDATDFVRITAGGSVKLTPTELLTDEQRKAISGIKEGKFGIELKLYDKLSALQMIGQHLGMFQNKAEKEVEDASKYGVVLMPALVEMPSPPEEDDNG